MIDIDTVEAICDAVERDERPTVPVEPLHLLIAVAQREAANKLITELAEAIDASALPDRTAIRERIMEVITFTSIDPHDDPASVRAWLAEGADRCMVEGRADGR